MRKITIDSLTSTSGWVVNSPSTITTQAFPDFIAGLNSTSIQIKFDRLDSVKTATKTFTAIDVSDQKTLVFSIWSHKAWRQDYDKQNDFSYKIKLNATQEFFIPAYKHFHHVEIGLEDVTSIDRIQITALHSITDYIIISEMIAEQEIIPLDILEELELDLENRITSAFSDGILIGTVTTATIADTSITFASTPDFVKNYSVVKIKDVSGEEIVHLGDRTGDTFALLSYEGSAGALQRSYSSAGVYLQFPVFLNPNEIDIRLPGIALWGISGDPISRGGKLDIQADTYTTTDLKNRLDMQIYEYSIPIDCQARQYELIDKMARIVRELIGGEKIYINGRKHDIRFDGPAVEQRPQVGFDIIPKLQYNCIIEVSENIAARETIPIVSTVTVEVEPEEE